jgi:hypothetical protein
MPVLAVLFASLYWPVLAQEPPLPPPPQPLDPRFGAVEAHYAAGRATEAGVAWERVLLYWKYLQPDGPGDWNVYVLPDGVLNQELAAGREVVAVLAGTPPWAADENGLPKGLYLPYDDPGNTWGQFVYRIVSMYKGRINRWVMWNEPDIWMVGHPGFTWPGSEADFYQLMKVGYLAAKAANPDCQVHLAGLTHYWDVQHGRVPFFVRLLAIIAQDPTAAEHNYYFDVVTLHLYFHSAKLYDIVRLYQGYMQEQGIVKPIWINEANCPPSEDPLDPVERPGFRVTLDEQAAFIIQAFALALTADVERIEVYKMIDYPRPKASIEPYGLVREDRSLRPAFYAFQVVTRYYAGAKKATRQTMGDVEIVRLDRGDKTTTVVWTTNRSGRSFALPAIALQGLLVHSDGSSEPLAAQGGRYNLQLAGATCTNGDDCLVGGMPLVIVEEGKAAASPPPASSPATPTLPLPTKPPSPTPAATSTPTPTATLSPPPTPTPLPPVSSALPAVSPTATPLPDVSDKGQPVCLSGLVPGLIVAVWLAIGKSS